MQAALFDPTPCELGEGPLWAEGRVFWFDILDNRLHARDLAGKKEAWGFDERVSAAAKLREGGLLIASESGLWRFDPQSGARERLAELEADNPATRSNDGRADRQGAFWIGTMGKKAEKNAGTIYRFYRGAVRPVRTGITIPNSICFSPDGRYGYFADTTEGRINRWELNEHGWPISEPEPFYEFGGVGGPDGAVVDSAGALWCANWGGGRVLRILPDGTPDISIPLPVRQPSCPAFGPDLDRLYITTAWEGMDAAARAEQPLAGAVFEAAIEVPGIEEPLVRLD